jgi:hypothetical protein
MPEVDGRVRELVDQVQTAVAHAVVTWHRQGRPILLVGRGSAGLTIPSSPCLHEAIVQAIDAITAGLRVLLRACRSTTLPFRRPDHARGRYDTTIVPCAAGSDVVEVSGPDVAGTGVPRVAGR